MQHGDAMENWLHGATNTTFFKGEKSCRLFLICLSKHSPCELCQPNGCTGKIKRKIGGKKARLSERIKFQIKSYLHQIKQIPVCVHYRIEKGQFHLKPSQDLVNKKLNMIIGQLLTLHNIIQVSTHQMSHQVPAKQNTGMLVSCQLFNLVLGVTAQTKMQGTFSSVLINPIILFCLKADCASKVKQQLDTNFGHGGTSNYGQH